MTNDITKWFDGVITGILAVMLVGGAVYQSVITGNVEPSLLVMATAVVSVYFTGRANRQVNGVQVDTLTKSVEALHKRFDDSPVIK